ncbi:unnamed protein product [marine sediment metagenome]|uniref:Uncharacterized protein n=1 Tax=marine sediment metagenome TaxID=412755 RepID=X1EZN1_9ZZZZ
MNTENSLSAKEFIQKIFIEETKRLVDAGSYHFAFVIMAQGIETLGSFLDSKPLKAREQSKLRFSHAINRLMPVKYAKLNNNHVLYDQLRASLAHTFTTSRQIYLTAKENPEYGNKHLQEIDEKLILVVEDFYKDFKKASERLLDGMNKGIIADRKINSEFYYTF